MKRLNILFILLMAVSCNTSAQSVKYESYFTQERLRIDLVTAGNAEKQEIFLDGLKKEFAWSGPKTNLIDPFEYGEYYLKLFSGDKVIYSKGFCTLFQEWRTTAEANITSKANTLSLITPFPKNEVKAVIYERVYETGEFNELFSINIDPNDPAINQERENDFEVVSIHHSGDAASKVDLLFIAEGYTADEMEKFRKDADKFKKYLFDIEPYRSRINDFNIRVVESLSEESGPDIPHQSIWRNTVLSTSFYTFGIDRYLTAPDHKKIASAASNAHYDALYVIVNTDKYGGGGIYNFYGLSMSDGAYEAEVFVHEFGHSFAGLADEYYTSDVAYEEFYNLKNEPWEPNITTLINFGSKWQSMLDPATPVPTPAIDENRERVGVYEGAGYMSKEIYRPYIDCRMHHNNAPAFCPVCQAAINRMIDYYAQIPISAL